MAKDPEASYEAGRRGAAWLKIKHAHTLDLVVLAAEWGHGRRRGYLSNLHLGARDPEGGGFVMLGKTFKGMTDAMLAWQTEKLLSLEVSRNSYTVHVRPELVVEIDFNDVQASSQYPGGVALRFARVKAYRTDKSAAEADTIAAVRALADAGRVRTAIRGHAGPALSERDKTAPRPSISAPNAAPSLRVDIVAGGPQGGGSLARRHRLHRKLGVPGAGRRALSADGARPARARLPLCADRHDRLDPGRHRRLLPGRARLRCGGRARPSQLGGLDEFESLRRCAAARPPCCSSSPPGFPTCRR